ncbi:MAG: hypothetical protein ACJ79S_21950 [Gemmatimonadaceae bacterium]
MSPSHPRRSPPPSRRASGGERVFTDDDGLLWSAVLQAPSAATGQGGEPGAAGSRLALVFACISDARQSPRAIAVDPALRVGEAGDDDLRRWLGQAPRMGRLS